MKTTILRTICFMFVVITASLVYAGDFWNLKEETTKCDRAVGENNKKNCYSLILPYLNNVVSRSYSQLRDLQPDYESKLKLEENNAIYIKSVNRINGEPSACEDPNTEVMCKFNRMKERR